MNRQIRLLHMRISQKWVPVRTSGIHEVLGEYRVLVEDSISTALRNSSACMCVDISIHACMQTYDRYFEKSSSCIGFVDLAGWGGGA